MISTQQIQYILQLSETKNFSKAANNCYVTQPTLSMQLKKAEEVLGFTIFDRDKNPLELTALGKQLVKIIQELNYYNEQIHQLSKKANGTFKEELVIGIIPTVSAYLIPLLYKSWKKQLLETRLIIKENKTEELLNLLENKKIDFAIIAGPNPDTTLKKTDLYVEELLAYNQNKKRGVVKTNSLLEQKPWLLSQGNCLRTQMVSFCKLNNEVQDDWNFEGGNIELLIKMVDINGGYTLVPKHYADILKNIKGSFHHIEHSKTKATPARSIIGIQSVRNTKSESIQKIISSIKLVLNKPNNKEMDIINWK